MKDVVEEHFHHVLFRFWDMWSMEMGCGQWKWDDVADGNVMQWTEE